MIRATYSARSANTKLNRRFSTLLQSVADHYDGIEVTEDCTLLSPEEFRDRLKFSLKNWKSDSRKGIWLRLPISASALIPEAVAQDFWYHHAGSDYLLLCNWLQGGKSESKLPPRASHYIGVSGFVLNSKQELLVIKEKSGPASKMDLWKLPGGLCVQNETLAAGSIREVKEETGIECEYLSLASIVEFSSGRSAAKEQSSDLYCVSVLRALDVTQPLLPQPGEIAACEWRPVELVLDHPFYAPSTAFGKAFRSALAVATVMKQSERSALGSSDWAEEGGTASPIIPCGLTKMDGSSDTERVVGEEASVQQRGVAVDAAFAGLSSNTFPLGVGRSRASVMYTKYTDL